MWKDIREPETGKLLCRYDPSRRLLEIQRRGNKTLVDLDEFERAMQNTFDGLQRVFEVFSVAARKAAEQMWGGIEPVLRNAYRNAGAPYGDTNDGFNRWLEELGEE